MTDLVRRVEKAVNDAACLHDEYASEAMVRTAITETLEAMMEFANADLDRESEVEVPFVKDFAAAHSITLK